MKATKGRTIRDVMTKTPHSIGQEQTLAKAAALMREFGVRHLPVLHGGELVGMVTERDVRFAEDLKGPTHGELKVEDVMAVEVYAVTGTATLAEVARHMAEHRMGSTVVMDGSKIAGIFTAVDACRLLAELA